MHRYLRNKNNLCFPFKVLADSQPQASPEVHTLCLFSCCSLAGLLFLSFTKQSFSPPAALALLLSAYRSIPQTAFHFRCPLTIETFLQIRTTCHLGNLRTHIMPGPKQPLGQIMCFTDKWENIFLYLHLQLASVEPIVIEVNVLFWFLLQI